MRFETIIFLKDGSTYQAVNMFRKEEVQGKYLQNYPNVTKETRGLEPGDIIVCEETENFFKNKVIEVKKFPDYIRKENLQKAYYQLLNCIDEDIYDFDNHPYVEKVKGFPLGEWNLYLTSDTIIESFIKIKKNELNTEHMRDLKGLLAELRGNMVNVVGINYSLGYGREDYENAFLIIKEKYNLKTDREAKETIHSNCLKYLDDIGGRVFAYDKVIDKQNENSKQM